MSAMASPSVSILNSYSASGENGSAVVGPGGFTPADGCTFMIKIDLSAFSGLGKAYKSVRSRRASPCGKLKSGPEKWCDMDLLHQQAHVDIAASGIRVGTYDMRL